MLSMFALRACPWLFSHLILFALGIELFSDMYITNKNQMIMPPPVTTKIPYYRVATQTLEVLFYKGCDLILKKISANHKKNSADVTIFS